MNFYGERQLLLSIYILNWLGVRVVFTERRFSTSLGLVWYGSRIKFPTGGIYTIKVIKQRDFAVLEYRVQTKFSKKFGFELHFKAKISLK